LRHSKSVLEAGLTIGSIPAGALLGVFLLGLLTKKPRETAAMVGVAAGLAVILLVRLETPIAWTWYVLIGTVATFLAALAASLFESKQASRPVSGVSVNLKTQSVEGAGAEGDQWN
jgi:SSS family solute:Na+ symporter